MRGRSIPPWLKLLCLLLALAAWPALAARAQTVQPGVSALTVVPLPPQPVGQRVDLVVDLVNEQGRPLPNKPLLLYLNGERVRRERTGDDGRATIRIGQDLPVGRYRYEVVFEGTEAYLGAAASGSFTVRPVQYEIEAVPPVAGIRYRLGNQIAASGPDGLARFQLDRLGTFPLEVVLLPGATGRSQARVAFQRWGDATFQPQRQVTVLGDGRIQAGFGLSHRVSLSFAGLQGEAVDEAQVATITFKTSNGLIYTFADGRPRWLPANRAVRRQNGLESSPIQYAVESVLIDGANVVNKYQQRFLVTPEATWQIQLLLYSARIRAVDALFGFPVGNGVFLEYPNERSEFVPFDARQELSVGPLARGIYRVQVGGVRGMAPRSPLALSRDQDVTLKVLTALDIGLATTLGLVGALGLLFYGRPELLTLPGRLLPARRARPAMPAYAGIWRPVTLYGLLLLVTVAGLGTWWRLASAQPGQGGSGRAAIDEQRYVDPSLQVETAGHEPLLPPAEAPAVPTPPSNARPSPGNQPAPLPATPQPALGSPPFPEQTTDTNAGGYQPFTFVVGESTTLAQVAEKSYGDSSLWPLIYQANQDRVDDPNALPVGLELWVPAPPGQ